MDSGVFSNYLWALKRVDGQLRDSPHPRDPQNAMPELPEVERASKLIRTVGLGKKIVRVESFEDAIVYSGTTHTEFLTRKVKGQLATYYKETPRTASTDWPPRFVKFILHLEATSDAGTTDTIELAFLDARRLGRIRLCSSPTKEPPISELGFDPILSMPSLEEFLKLVVKRSCPIKALLLDQSFSAGVGNWVADEILYHAHVHPEQRCNTLTEEQVARLREKMVYVCETAVEANADDTKFPDDWLFKHRWGKGKKAAHNMVLPSGEPATIKWIKVGGRTSAFVFELQTTPPGPARSSRKRIQRREEADDSDLPPLTESESEEPPAKRLTRSRSQKTDVSSPRKGNLSRASKKREE
ncbi:uncharacterized protein ARMOST_09667 [Armillaria ostoyae]|uniref:Formamidopyrimidine-DNA glycosylase catalytic domain-containing protein n=1 Tax=Armillaria ostoyae TaxID=47428 RepID=A0A284RC54_ARMOS|nr:uncharacterized protein ARMOST_09667 [Armillaria ostoyae]